MYNWTDSVKGYIERICPMVLFMFRLVQEIEWNGRSISLCFLATESKCAWILSLQYVLLVASPSGPLNSSSFPFNSLKKFKIPTINIIRCVLEQQGIFNLTLLYPAFLVSAFVTLCSFGLKIPPLSCSGWGGCIYSFQSSIVRPMCPYHSASFRYQLRKWAPDLLNHTNICVSCVLLAHSQ